MAAAAGRPAKPRQAGHPQEVAGRTATRRRAGQRSRSGQATRKGWRAGHPQGVALLYTNWPCKPIQRSSPVGPPARALTEASASAKQASEAAAGRPAKPRQAGQRSRGRQASEAAAGRPAKPRQAGQRSRGGQASEAAAGRPPARGGPTIYELALQANSEIVSSRATRKGVN